MGIRIIASQPYCLHSTSQKLMLVIFCNRTQIVGGLQEPSEQILRDTAGIELSNAVGVARIEEFGLLLEDLICQAVELGNEDLVDALLGRGDEDEEDILNQKGAGSVGSGSVFRNLEGHSQPTR